MFTNDYFWFYFLKETMIPKNLKNLLKKKGEISLSEYMEFCLFDNETGYYQNLNNISNDFVTSPEISQLFGEIIAIFFLFLKEYSNVNSFKDINSIVELGPGNGTLMVDFIRVLEQKYNNVRFNIYLFEKSKNLILQQKKKFKETKNQLFKFNWIKNLKMNVNKPKFFLCNEFFDSLPINQYFYENNNFYEKKIFLYDETLKLIKKRVSNKIIVSKNCEDGDIIEYSELAIQYLTNIFDDIEVNGSILLLIDYGPFSKKKIDTIQAIHSNKKVSIFHKPGMSDITYHVNFEDFIDLSKKYKINFLGPISQSKFLSFFGINERLDSILKSTQSLDERKKIESGFYRLVNQNEMGGLFKFMIFSKEKINLPF